MAANLRKFAQGKECQVRIPGYCNRNDETVVLAHLRLAGITGMGMKAHDILGAHCCSSCHDVVDYRVKTELTKTEIENMFYEGIARTQAVVLKEFKFG